MLQIRSRFLLSPWHSRVCLLKCLNKVVLVRKNENHLSYWYDSYITPTKHFWIAFNRDDQDTKTKTENENKTKSFNYPSVHLYENYFGGNKYLGNYKSRFKQGMKISETVFVIVIKFSKNQQYSSFFLITFYRFLFIHEVSRNK